MISLTPGGARRCGGQDESSDWEVVGVEAAFIRPDYDPVTHANDIAVLRLTPGLELNPRVQPVMLPDSETMRGVVRARVTGWGGVFSQDPGRPDNHQQALSCFLQEAELEVEIPG